MLCILFFFLLHLTCTHVCLTLSPSVCHGQISLLFLSLSFKLLLFPVAFLHLAALLCSDLDDVDSLIFFLSVCCFFFFFFEEEIKETKKIKCKMKVLILHVFASLGISKLLLLCCSCFGLLALLITLLKTYLFEDER